MLFTQTIETGTLDLIKRLMQDPEFDDFNLVGGTALALKLGHRKSIDIDLFTNKGFDSDRILKRLKGQYGSENNVAIQNGIFCLIDGVKTDFIAHQYPLINPIEELEGIRMASLEDIEAMKLNAILNSGARLKDFVDIFSLLECRPLNKLTEAFVKKYPNVNKQMAHNAMIYFNDINARQRIDFVDREIHLKEIKSRLNTAVGDEDRIFYSLNPENRLKQSDTPRKGQRPKW